MLRKVLKNLGFGAAFGSLMMNLTMLCFYLSGGAQVMTYIVEDYRRQLLCSLVVGITFCLLSMVYDLPGWSWGLKVLVHMGGGMAVYFVVAVWAGWMPLQAGVGPALLFLAIGLAFAFLIWLGFFLYNFSEAKRLNQALHEKRQA